MVTKKDIAVAILATFCLTSTLFMIAPTRSQTETPEYDPWTDLNDDGIIDIFDIVQVALAFEAEGEPINKTLLLQQVNDTYSSLLSRIDSLNSTLLAMQSNCTNLMTTLMALNQTVEDLESEIIAMNATGLGKPNYDSGWVSTILVDKEITHNLNTTNVIVYMIGKATLYGEIHQKDYGGWMGNINWYGAYWYGLTTTDIVIHRHGNDGDWVYARIFMWIIP